MKRLSIVLLGWAAFMALAHANGHAEDGYASEAFWRRQRHLQERHADRHEERHRERWTPPRRERGPVYGYTAPERHAPRGGLDAMGMTTLRTDSGEKVTRDVLSDVLCFPLIEELSAEHNTEEGAWKDAQRSFENRARWMYGERAMAITNAAQVSRQCSRSSGNESLLGRATEAAASAVGLQGYKHRCAIRARPCVAPVEMDPDTKGQKQ